MTTKIRVLPVYGGGGSISTPSPTIDPGKVYVDTKTTTVVISTNQTTATSSDYESNIVAIATQYDETGVLVGTDLEIAGVDELLFDELTNATYISINNTNFEVDINGISTPDYTLNTIDYVTTKVLSNNIVFDTSTGSEPSTKISFLL